MGVSEFLVVLLIVRTGIGFRFSNFLKTELFEEMLDLRLKKTIDGLTLMTCGRECLGDSECRRFKFCETDATTGQCKLYEDGKDCPNFDTGQVCSCYQKKMQCDDGACTCPIGYYGNRCEYVIKHCGDGIGQNLESLGRKISFIQPDSAEEPFEVFCEFQYGLTTIQSRDLKASPVDFNRSMEEYIHGFGHPRYNFWLGLHRISLISAIASLRCNIYLQTASSSCQTFYDRCSFGGGHLFYLRISSFSTEEPNCGDSLTAVDNINDTPFSTYDSDHTGYNCASKMAAGWWYAPTTACTQGNLNAPLVSLADVTTDPGVMRMKWSTTLGDELLQYSLIRVVAKTEW